MEAARLVVRVIGDTSHAEQSLARIDRTVQSTAKSLAATSFGMTAGLTAPIVAASKTVFDIGKSFESAFTGVIKTVDGTAAEIGALRSGMLEMAKALPSSFEEIAGVAEAAGQLGIAKENILDFTRTMIDLGETTNLSATSAAQDLARFANITGMAQTEFDRLGSSIVALGNNLATTEAEIVAMGMRIAGAGAQVGLSEAEILGFAGALSSVGIEAEAGGTAFSRVMVDIAQEVATGGKKLKTFAKVAGVSSDAFATAWKEDATGALIAFVEGLGRISEEGGNVFGVLEELELADIRVRDALLRASGAGDLFRRSVELSSKAWEENIALTKEAELRYGTTESRLAILRNRFRDVGNTLFDAVKPNVESVIGGFSDFVGGIGNAIKGLGTIDPALVNAALAFGAVLAIAGPLVGVMAAVAGAFALLGGAAAPILLVTGAVAGLAAGVAAIATSDFLGIRTAFESWIAPLQTAWAQIQGIVETGKGIVELGNIRLTWTPEVKTLQVGDVIKGIWTPEYKSIDVANVITGLWTPEYKRIAVKNVFTGEWTPEVTKINVADVIVGTYKPEFSKVELGPIKATITPEVASLEAGPIDILATPKWADMQFGPIDVLVTPEFTKVEAGELTVEVTPEVNKVLVNGKTIPQLDWKEVIGIGIDWATVVPALAWDAFVLPLDWAALVGVFSWKTWIEPLQWSEQVGEVDLADPAITPQLSWQIFVSKLEGGFWNGVVPALEWHNFIVGTSLSSFVEKLEWGPFISGVLHWPTPKEILSAIVDAARKTAIAATAADFTRPRFDTEWPDRIISLDRRSGGAGRSGFIEVPARIGEILPPTKTPDPIEIPVVPNISWGIFPEQSIKGLEKMYTERLKEQFRNITPEDIFGQSSDEKLSFKVQVTEVEPAATLKPLQISAMINSLTMSEDIGSASTKLSTGIESSLAGFSWPSLPEWVWPTLPTFTWPALPEWRWPPIERPAWLDQLRVPRPDWLGQLLAWQPEVVIRSQAQTVPGQLASGTNYWRGGLTWVGERGPELVNLPRGSRVYDHNESMAMAGAGGIHIMVNANVASDLDVETLAQRIARIIERRGRGLG